MSGKSLLPRPGGLRELSDNSANSHGQSMSYNSASSRYDQENMPTKRMLPPPNKSVLQDNASVPKRKYADDGAQQQPSGISRSAIAKAPKTPTRTKSNSGSLRMPGASVARPGSSMGQRPGASRPAYLSQQADRPQTAMGFSSNAKSLVEKKENDDGKLKEDVRSLIDRMNEMEKKHDLSVVTLETKCTTLETLKTDAEIELRRCKDECDKLTRLQEDDQRRFRNELDDMARKLRNESDDMRRRGLDEIEALKRAHQDEVSEIKSKSGRELDRAEEALKQVKSALEDEKMTKLREITEIRARLEMELEVEKTTRAKEFAELKSKSEREIEEERSARVKEVTEIKFRLEGELEGASAKLTQQLRELQLQSTVDKQRLEQEVESRDAKIRSLQEEVAMLQKQNLNLKDNLGEQSSNTLSLESSNRALRERILNLEAVGKDQNDDLRCQESTIEMLQRQLEESKAKLRTEETLRRKLHNQVLELKGNIRVFCRVRPPLEHENEPANINFPDSDKEAKDIVLQGKPEKTSLGSIVMKPYSFSFDKVFGPSCQNPEIFEEISQLVQSALDGYNVCIFCYGQTGSGKTYTMTSSDGMIPLAVSQIYRHSQDLEEKGWHYTMEGSFIEVYNETLNDLLGNSADLDRKKHEIRHENGKTIITGCTSITLDTPARMEEVMMRASQNRSVAATKANERSSRSHSVFILKLIGHNSITGERSEGVLNLVDLAGSERLSHSQATGDRLKETQNINKSLSSLGDVICALGSASGKEKAHIPYRNSKLTYLLQNSLGGNSKTLMFVMVSPLQAHLSETVTSLTFATKVSNTFIGTAKKMSSGSKIKYESEDTVNIREQGNLKYLKEA